MTLFSSFLVRDIRAVYPLAASRILDGLDSDIDRLLCLDLDEHPSEYRRAAIIVRHGKQHGVLLVADRWGDGRNTISHWIAASFFSADSEPGDRALGEDLVKGYLQLIGVRIAFGEIRPTLLAALFESH